MYNEKIFKELEGVFKWIEHKKKEKDKKQESQDSYHQIKEFFNFLNLEATNEEIEALKELASLNKESLTDKEEPITYQDLYKVFVQDEKSLEKEEQDLRNAFRVLSKDEEYIYLKKLESDLGTYDKKYKNSIEMIMNELKQSNHSDGQKLNYKDFLDDQYNKGK